MKKQYPMSDGVLYSTCIDGLMGQGIQYEIDVERERRHYYCPDCKEIMYSAVRDESPDHLVVAKILQHRCAPLDTPPAKPIRYIRT